MASNVGFSIPICPITQEAIQDAVIDPEGNSYERLAILTWLVENSISPVTRKPLSIDALIPNRALMDMIAASTSEVPSGVPCRVPSGSGSGSCMSCAICNKPISVSNKYKGKKNPTCFKCRPWNCKHCTYSNDSHLTRCDMCKLAKL